MDDYISREAAIHAANRADDRRLSLEDANKMSAAVVAEIENLPAADVRPVQWIPVEERLPEADKMVLVVRSDGDMAVAGWNAALGWLHYWSGFRVRNVTHWMPLPELPKEEEANDNQR